MGQSPPWDYVEFRNDEIRWRWKSEGHRHVYVVDRVGNRNLIVGYLPSNPTKPEIFGIYTIKDGNLVICDRDASLGYPSGFSADEGTLLVLKPDGSKEAEQGAAPNPYQQSGSSSLEHPSA